ncbi:uncharacterized protein [Choristoneura fumiferana]|uniref:uncharacterized protein n=1 Tax=Choristoneura fumiferana TaxID=7141 RepID=UPI003D154819
MGAEDDLNSAIAHVVLCCVCGPCIGHMHGKSFSGPGFHTNLFIHGVIGFLHYQGGKFGDFSAAYKISLAASRYLPIPCLMADLNRSNEVLSCVHVISGLVPFALALSGSDNPHLGNMMIACNIIALAYHAYEKNKEWAWYTAGAATVAYFAAPQMGTMGPKVMYPLCLAVMEYCGHRVYHSNVTIVEPRK